MTTETDEQAARKIRLELDARDNSNMTDEELCLEYARRLLAWERRRAEPTICPRCNGTGKILVNSFRNSTKQIENSCSVCKGKGKLNAVLTQDAPATGSKGRSHE